MPGNVRRPERMPIKFGYWGDWPHWRCTENKFHRQSISKAHLRLPKMLAMVPQEERRKLCEILKIERIEDCIINSNQREKCVQQGMLFEKD